MLSETEVELLRTALNERVRQAAADQAAHAATRTGTATPSLLQLVMRFLNGEPSRFPTGRPARLLPQS